MAMTSTPYFDAYERGERSVSHIMKKLIENFKHIYHPVARLTIDDIVRVQPMTGNIGRTFPLQYRPGMGFGIIRRRN